MFFWLLVKSTICPHLQWPVTIFSFFVIDFKNLFKKLYGKLIILRLRLIYRTPFFFPGLLSVLNFFLMQRYFTFPSEKELYCLPRVLSLCIFLYWSELDWFILLGFFNLFCVLLASSAHRRFFALVLNFPLSFEF